MAEIALAAVVNLAISTALAYAFPTNTRQEGQRLEELGIVGSAYGAGIPILHGRDRLPGNIVWATPLREQRLSDEYSAGKGSTVTAITYQYYATFAALLCAGDAAMQPRRVWCDKKLLWEAPDTSVHLSGDLAGGGSFEWMPGSAAQTRSAIMEAVLGTADCPAYRGRCCIVFSELPVEQFGRRIPLVEVEVARGAYNESAVVADVLLDLCLQAGLDSGEVDVSAITAEVHGVRLMPGQAGQMIGTLIDGLGLQAIGTGTQIAFRPIEQTVAAEIDADELLAGGQRFPMRRLREDQLPRSVAVSHLDPERDYQRGTQLQQRQAVRSVQASRLDAPLVLSAAQAFGAADAILYRAWTARTQYGPFGLLPHRLELEPGDVVGVTVDGVRHEVRLRSVEIGAQGALQCEGEAYDSAVLTGATGGNSGAFPGQALPSYGTTTLRLLDVPALSDAEAAQVGYRIAATGAGSAWRSGVLEVSVDAGDTWLTAAVLSGYTVMGYAGATPLPDPPAHIGAANIDTTSTVQVTLVKGTLASVTDELLIAGANRCLVGGELIQFGTATLVSGTTYSLSRLLRGRRGTEGAMVDHVADEPFVLLSGTPFVPASVADLGAARLYRITPTGGEASGSVSFTLAGASARPFGPVAVAGSRDGGLNLTISWTRRSRIGTELPDSGDIPLDEPSESYSVDILDGAAVVRTIAASTPSATYTAAQQVADFGGAQPAVTVRIHQVGQLVGRGTAAEATV
jgi:hypothetical protein